MWERQSQRATVGLLSSDVERLWSPQTLGVHFSAHTELSMLVPCSGAPSAHTYPPPSPGSMSARKLAPVVTSLAVIVFFRDCPQTLAFLEGVCVLSWGSLTASSSPDSSCSACVTLLSQPPE